MDSDTRKYIRHPIDIPLHYTVGKGDADVHVKDLSESGLCFTSTDRISTGEHIHIAIPIFKPEFIADGIVCWCKRAGDAFLIGVSFQDQAIAYAIRMMEQVCHIENYRNEILRNKGIELTNEQAAQEWIEVHAADFHN